MKILAVSPTDLNNLNAGNKIAIYRTLREFQTAGHEINYLCYTDEEILNNNNFNNPKGLNKPKKVNLLSIYKMITGESYLFTRFYSTKMVNEIINKLENDNIEILLFEHTYMAIHLINKKIKNLVKEKNIKVIVDSHVLEYEAYEKLFEKNNKKSILHRKFLRSIEKSEKKYISKADMAITYGKEDYQEIIKYTNKDKVLLKPVSMDIDPVKNVNKEKAVIFYGTFSWFPNEDGLRYFINEIIEHVDKDIKVYIAGRNIPKWAYKVKKDNLIILGEVESMKDTVANKALTIVPLRIGGGTRIKILEAMSWGKAVLSTRIGAEGICKEGEDGFIIIEDNPIKFAEKINYYLNNDEKLSEFESKSLEFIEKNYSESIISKQINIKIYDIFKLK
ncbi:glycosyltransferase [Clostridium tertium]|uniref:Glycosyl transferases group 1 n=1 Tax=Clostridium tertium TaxID=1559 RepID=A0A6N2ZGS7_9CLOT